MKLLFTAILLSLAVSCGSPAAVNNSAPKAGTAITSSPSPTAMTPIPEPSTPKNGDYPAKGVVTKVDTNLGSVELDHQEIVGVMPAMKMEFYVSDKKLLDGLKVGDQVDFTLRYKDYTETIVGIKKAK